MELQQQLITEKAEQEAQIEQLSCANNELELRYRVLKADYDKETESLKLQLVFIEQQKQKAMDQTKTSDVQKLKLIEVTEERYKQQIFQLEHDLDQA